METLHAREQVGGASHEFINVVLQSPDTNLLSAIVYDGNSLTQQQIQQCIAVILSSQGEKKCYLREEAGQEEGNYSPSNRVGR